MVGEFSGLGAAAVWAIVATGMRAASDRISPVMINGLRCTFAATTLALLLVLTGRTGSLFTMPFASVAAIVASGVLGQAMGDALLVKAMKLMGSARAFPITSTNPLLTIALATVFLGEQVSWMGAAGAALVVLGIWLLAFPRGTQKGADPKRVGDDRMGPLVAFGSAACYAASNVVLKQGLVGVDLLAANLIRLVTAAVFLVGVEALNSGGHVAVGLTRRSLTIMVGAGGLNAFSSLMFIIAVHFAGAAKASVLASTSPLFALPLSIIFLRERINRRIAAGTLLAVFGIWLVLGG